jgi:divalent metal cation (Fe/Co/Zn/Cd) transporter
MIRNGLAMFGRSLPTLLDARASAGLRRDIAEAVRAEIPQAKLLSLRTRLAGETCVAEVTLAADPQTTPSVLCEGGGAAEERLRRAGHHVDLAVVPFQAGGDGPDETAPPASDRASRLAIDSGGPR